MLISVVIPTHNRPAFLLEAINSIALQTYTNFEVVVVDDGSDPPIVRSVLEEVLGVPVALCRHDSAQGVPKAKNAGIRAARGEIILLLDDDDLLRPNALESVFHAFADHAEIDCLFLGVYPFGPYADGASRSRREALSTVISRSKPQERDGLYFFSKAVFNVLLDTVPIDFQRPAARRGAWNIIGGFDEKNSLFCESAWAIRASSFCMIALTKECLTGWRMHGNNFFSSSPSPLEQTKMRQIDNGILVGGHLLETFVEQEKAWRVRSRMVKNHYSGQFFSKAYYLRDKDWFRGLKALIRSFLLAPRPIHLKLAAKYSIPLYWLKRCAFSDKDMGE